MDHNRFYKQLFQPIEERIGHVDGASMANLDVDFASLTLLSMLLASRSRAIELWCQAT
jgi:hypothetical protein